MAASLECNPAAVTFELHHAETAVGLVTLGEAPTLLGAEFPWTSAFAFVLFLALAATIPDRLGQFGTFRHRD